jgi:hypothetical protein
MPALVRVVGCHDRVGDRDLRLTDAGGLVIGSRDVDVWDVLGASEGSLVVLVVIRTAGRWARPIGWAGTVRARAATTDEARAGICNGRHVGSETITKCGAHLSRADTAGYCDATIKTADGVLFYRGPGGRGGGQGIRQPCQRGW